MVDISLIIPAYNEGFRIADTLNIVTKFMKKLGKTYEIIVVNDGSTDDTLEILQDRFSARSDLRIITYLPNRGKGYATREGVLASNGRLVGFTDTDLSAPISELTKLIDSIDNGAVIAIGSRAVKNSELVVRQPKYRELGGRCLNLIIQIFAVSGVHDTQCGFKLFRGDSGRYLFKKCIIDGWGFDIEILYLARRLGLRIDEVPVKWAHAEGSKISPFKAGAQVLKDIFRMRINDYSLDENA